MWLIKQLINIFELIYKEGEKEWLDETKYIDALNELYEGLQNGELNEEEYDLEEEKILEQLRKVREYKKEHSIGGD